jgi:hypothetical protein
MSAKGASNPAVSFAISLAGVISVAVGLAMIVRVFPSSSGPSVEGLVALLFFIVGMLVSLHRLRRDIVGDLLDKIPSDRSDG